MRINGWAQEQTKDRIKDLIPKGGIDATTRLVLCNAVHLQAPWAVPFTQLSQFPFSVNGERKVTVPGLRSWSSYGYLKVPGGAAVTIPYADIGLQFVILVPDEVDGLAGLEKQLTAKTFADAAKAKPQEVLLKMPEFKLTPETENLAKHLEQMGMRTAFDIPNGSADFSRMATRTPSDYLFVKAVFHKAFIAVDKNGTEAAAATAVAMARGGGFLPDQPIEVWADRPFAFAIQHTASGACLFLGRVTDPR
jgi:serpin B